MRPDVITITDLLKQSGYRTYITGKWDLGGRKDDALLPDKRGFEKSFVLVEGSADHFRHFPALAELPDINYRLNGAVVDTLPEDFYSTTAFTDYMLSFLKEGAAEQSDAPFFAYLSYTAPHYPIQAPDEAIAKFKGKFDAGYEAIIEQRLVRMQEMGLIDENITPAKGHDAWPKWEDLTDKQKQFETRRMETYAGMIDVMDANIGRVLDQLEASGELDNTIVLFMSDNGAEGGNPLDWAPYYTDWAKDSFDLSLENLGRPLSFAWTGPGWAQVGSAPYALYKGFAAEGGTRVPAILNGGRHVQRQGVNNTFAHVMDIPATILDYAGIEHPGDQTSGFTNRALEGESLKQFLNEQTDQVHNSDRVHVWEMLDRRAVRKGDWKLTLANQPWGKGDWALYNLKNDPTEQQDVSDTNPEKVKELISDWEDYVTRNNLILVEGGIDILWTNIKTHYDWTPVPAISEPAASK